MRTDFSAMIYSSAQVREGEQRAAEAQHISMAQLMQRAAQACLRAIQQQHSAPAQLLVLCGPGNNGGDGWVLARLAQQAGYRVTVAATAPKSSLAIAAAAAWHDLGGLSMALEDLTDNQFDHADVVVDALLGTGLTRDLDSIYQALIERINRKVESQRIWLLSIDVPTGLDSDTGCPRPLAVRAHKTVTMVALKVGLVTGQAANFCGVVELADLGLGNTFYNLPPTLRSISEHLVSECLPRRLPASHKGSYGHVVIIGGGPGMSGAVRLAGSSALRCGAGKVSIFTHPENHLAVAIGQAELMVHSEATALAGLLAAASVVVIGPGLGQTPWAHNLVKQLTVWAGTVVWDADALNVLAEQPAAKPPAAQWYFTPHPGEAGRLLRQQTAVIEGDRLAALTQICQNFQASVLLKGAGTLVQNHESSVRWVCRRGSPALATGGSGDVLTGVVAAMVAQKVAADAVLPLAAWLHAVAGEYAAQHGERGTLASDLLVPLRALVNPMQATDSHVDN